MRASLFVSFFAISLALVPASAGAASLYGGGTYVALGTNVHGAVFAQNAGAAAEVRIDVGEGATGTPSNQSDGTDGLNVMIRSAADVSTDADLSTYQEQIANENEEVAETNADANGNVEVAYWHTGKLFGLISIKVKSETRIETDTDGAMVAKTSMPWWNMFVTGTGDVAADIDSSLNGTAAFSADAKATADAATRARLIEAMIRTHASVAASADL